MTSDGSNIVGGFYTEEDRFPVSVDCIVFSLHAGRLSVLLAPRRFQPHRGAPSLMGGFVEKEESLAEAAERVLRELTGLDNVYMEQVGAFGAPDRDPGERVISVAYFALIKGSEAIDKRIKEYGASWVEIEKLDGLHFDHPLMIRQALKKLRRKIAFDPLAFNLLPEMFTLAQAQALYEMILGEPTDKRNFRRRILENACIEPTDCIDKESSRRGAMLYRLNYDIYTHDQKFKI